MSDNLSILMMPEEQQRRLILCRAMQLIQLISWFAAKVLKLVYAFKIAKATMFPLALWVLELDSELLFVGDEGTTEASRASRRYGAELSAYYWLGEQFSVDLEVAWTRSRFTEDAEGEGNYVDNSLPFVLSAGINYKPIEPVNVNLRLRHFGRRFLESFGEVRGQSFTVLNLGMSYDYQNWQFGVDVLNLLNSNDRDIEYFFESRLAGEPEEGIADIHFHPIQPRSLRFKATYRF